VNLIIWLSGYLVIGHGEEKIQTSIYGFTEETTITQGLA
jgi:hypothetical protein